MCAVGPADAPESLWPLSKRVEDGFSCLVGFVMLALFTLALSWAPSTNDGAFVSLRAALTLRRSCGGHKCDICGRSSLDFTQSFGDAVFESHHVVPLASGQERNTRLKDLALLCANCHRMVHRAIAHTKRWLTTEEAKLLILGKAVPPLHAQPTSTQG